MMPGRTRRFAHLRLAREMWRELRPDDKVSKGRAVRGDISFAGRRAFESGMIFEAHVQFLSLIGDPWTIAVRGVCGDERVKQLRNEVQGFENEFVLSFDVLATHNFLEGKKRWILPKCDPDASNEKIRKLFLGYVKKLDAIWDVVGGFRRENFQALVLWQIANRANTGAGSADLPMACAAYIYGKPRLALELLAEFEGAWARVIRESPHSVSTKSIHAKVEKDIERLRRTISKNRIWKPSALER